jgi:hypothetical protein
VKAENTEQSWQQSLSLAKGKFATLWNKVTLYVYDAPRHISKTYKERHQLITESLKDYPQIKTAKPIECTGKDNLLELIKGGKQVLLYNPKSFYYSGSLRVAREKPEMDVLVHRQTNEELFAKLYAITIKELIISSPNTIEVRIPSQEGLQTGLAGSVITIAFDHKNEQGIPLNPSFIRIRDDLLWEVRNFATFF